ncbi:MAG TPA: hypothetical protein VFM70_12945 [Salinimicrobium sp.]|nr:hypothetical protein [Salinimicrobium sp.]
MKEQLQSREIEPSEKSWDRLYSKLDANQESKKLTKYWWLGIAAAVAVGIFIGSVIFKNPVNTEPEIVETPTQINSEETRLVDSEENNAETIAEKPHISEIKKSVIRAEKVAHTFSNSEKPALVPERSEEMKPIHKDFIEPETRESNYEIAEINVGKQEYSVEKEVDDLLAQAQREIILDQSYNQNVVNSEDLLQDVEADIDRSFRNEVFEMIKTGFSNIKIAMAEKK